MRRPVLSLKLLTLGAASGALVSKLDSESARGLVANTREAPAANSSATASVGTPAGAAAAVSGVVFGPWSTPGDVERASNASQANGARSSSASGLKLRDIGCFLTILAAASVRLLEEN